MARPKALLPCGPSADTFVARLIASLRGAGLDEVMVVARAGDDQLGVEVARCHARFVENPDADRGQLSSLLIGIDAADRQRASGALVMPVDIPLVRADTIARVRDAFLASDPPIARAVYQGRHGHPVIFGRGVFAALRRADPATGARAVVRAHSASIVDVDVDDEMILRDVDTPDDYRELFGRW
jgi:CTP:molybdopterin cytidylyltransferase MocA